MTLSQTQVDLEVISKDGCTYLKAISNGSAKHPALRDRRTKRTFPEQGRERDKVQKFKTKRLWKGTPSPELIKALISQIKAGSHYGYVHLSVSGDTMKDPAVISRPSIIVPLLPEEYVVIEIEERGPADGMVTHSKGNWLPVEVPWECLARVKGECRIKAPAEVLVISTQ